jgi:hypothetical protein
VSGAFSRCKNNGVSDTEDSCPLSNCSSLNKKDATPLFMEGAKIYGRKLGVSLEGGFKKDSAAWLPSMADLMDDEAHVFELRSKWAQSKALELQDQWRSRAPPPPSPLLVGGLAGMAGVIRPQLSPSASPTMSPRFGLASNTIHLVSPRRSSHMRARAEEAPAEPVSRRPG